MRHQRHDAEAMALSGYSSDSIEDATDVATAQVIRYMETMHGKVLKDYSYNELKQTKERELHLIGLLRDKEKEIKEQNLKTREISKGFADYMYQVKNIFAGIHSIAKGVVCSTSSTNGNDLSKAAVDVQNELAHLDQLTDYSMKLIQNTGVYPF